MDEYFVAKKEGRELLARVHAAGAELAKNSMYRCKLYNVLSAIGNIPKIEKSTFNLVPLCHRKGVPYIE